MERRVPRKAPGTDGKATLEPVLKALNALGLEMRIETAEGREFGGSSKLSP